jgi:hypothetical protein
VSTTAVASFDLKIVTIAPTAKMMMPAAARAEITQITVMGVLGVTKHPDASD